MSEREILFRGKRKDNGDWIYGVPITDEATNDAYIITSTAGASLKSEINNMCATGFRVIRNTIGQYTGLTDKNGTRIFEGDIVKITDFHTTAIAAVKYGSTNESTSWGWYFEDNDGHTYFLMSKAFCEDYNGIIIGNIHDNPELLKGE